MENIKYILSLRNKMQELNMNFLHYFFAINLLEIKEIK